MNVFTLIESLKYPEETFLMNFIFNKTRAYLCYNAYFNINRTSLKLNDLSNMKIT